MAAPRAAERGLGRAVLRQPLLTQPLLLLSVLLAGRAVAAAPGRPPVQLSSSVMVFSNPDLDQPTPKASRCGQMLRAAAEHGSRSVNIVVTQYWIDHRFEGLPKSCNPDAWAAPSRVDHYCHYWRYANGCQPWSPQAVANVTRGLTACLSMAFDLFDEVLISPHLDDGTRTGHWRNMLVFDPLQPDSNGYTYDDIMIRPITKAAAAALGGRKRRGGGAPKKLWFGLQGEMGGTIFRHPASWSTLAARVRKDLSGLPSGSVLVGVLLNHGYLPGVINRGPDSPPLPLPETATSALSGGWGPLLAFDKWPAAGDIAAALPAARALLANDVDFLGISNYNRAPVDVGPGDMENAVAKYDAELAVMGIGLLNLTARPVNPVKFIYNEVAIGGGASECGNVAAAGPEQVGRFPWLGIFSGYSRATDPFKLFASRLVDIPNRTYMRKWYASLLKVLERGGLRYPVSGAFLWNCASWDVQGIYPGSVTREGSYADPETVERIRRHNAAAAQAVAATVGTGRGGGRRGSSS